MVRGEGAELTVGTGGGKAAIETRRKAEIQSQVLFGRDVAVSNNQASIPMVLSET